MKSRISSILLILAFLALSCQREQELFDPQSYDDLTGHVVCLLEGSAHTVYADKYLKDKGITFTLFPSISDCMLAVRQNKADMFFGADMNAYTDAFREQHLRISHIVPDLDLPVGFGVSKENTLLKEQCNHYLDSISLNGGLKEISDRWINPDNTDFHDVIRIDPIPAEPKNADKVLRLGIAGVKHPTEVLIDNKWTGMEIELAQRIAARYGYSIEIKVYDFNNLIPAIQSGKADLVAATIMISEERLEKIDFTTPHALLRGAFFVADKLPDDRGTIFSRIAGSFETSFIKENRWKLIFQGLWTTLFITFLSLIGGFILGGLICRMRMSGNALTVRLAKLYLNFMRNIPILVLLMLMFYVVFARSGLDAIWVAIIAFSMNTSAFFCETFHTGICAVDKGQTEAGRAMGCSAFKTFIYIVMPQAARISMPVFKNECITLLKGTSIVGYISIIDITKASDLIRSSTFEAFLPLITITIFYFIMAGIITTLLDRLMKRL